MRVKVNEDVCVGCGACQGIAPEVFEMMDSGLAKEIEEEVKAENEEAAMDAKEGCPVGAIYDPAENE